MTRRDRVVQYGVAGVALGLLAGAAWLWAVRGAAIFLDLADILYL